MDEQTSSALQNAESLLREGNLQAA
jgi:hypothetical protein